ncbi:hypothetical protein D0B54_05600 [Solimonas sp. K1W22B-7]|uniref:hypothetical protein n=1 Tax=Solimonas sp. K1W22B-7 TaxID=2303331 RepID=UPI000E331344|nr:hypothetical protein [Solimonas sp. K1W22B-7]AXQ28182.1 hypothetical protein D0B54_05600 [Solimonas sp. K1W22B-7]
MSRLASRAELLKLALLTGSGADELAYLEPLPSETLRQLRIALLERYSRQQGAVVRRLAAIARWLPTGLIVLLARWWLGPALTARIAGEMPAPQAAAITQRLDPAFMADVAAWLDPRRARELIRLVAVERIVDVAQAMLSRGDYVTMGRFVEYLSDDAVRAVADTIADEGELMQIVFHVESKNRLDHLVRVLPPERVRKAILLVLDPARRPLWPKILSLVTHVGYVLKRELGDLAASQGDAVLDAIIHAAQEEDLWEDILPVVTCLSPEVQARVVNLDAIRRPPVMRRILRAADEAELWSELISLLQWMENATRDAVADAVSLLPPEALGRIAYAALLREQWEPTLDVVRRLPQARREECLRIVEGYRPHADTETMARIDRRLRHHGLVAEAV